MTYRGEGRRHWTGEPGNATREKGVGLQDAMHYPLEPLPGTGANLGQYNSVSRLSCRRGDPSPARKHEDLQIKTLQFGWEILPER
jgi:hypothetical protein